MPLAGKGPSSAKESAKRLKEKELALWLRLRAERKNSARLDPAKVRQTDIPFINITFSPECCSKVYIRARGLALKAQYNLLGDYYEMTDCEILKREGCDDAGGYFQC